MIHETGRSPALRMSPRQRWSIGFSYVVIALGLLLGWNLRDAALTQSSLYVNNEAGVTALYPARWLLEEGGADTVFRARDMARRGFNTVIEVRAMPLGPDSVARNVFDQLSLGRAQVLIDYSVFGYGSYAMPDESLAATMSYAFVSRDASPFLQSLSSLVRGLDILTIRRGQALVISFRAETDLYERERETLRWFIENLQF